ncbi:MAG: hypothetical protein JXR05_08000 [Flavobacteriaceae bacterium]
MKTKIVAILVLFTIVSTSCNGYGKKLEYQKTEVYYTSKVDKKEAQRLGEFLVRAEFADGKEKSVQLTKDDFNGNYIFRMVTTKEASESKYYETIFKLFSKQISDSVFNKTPVDFHICDNTFNMLKVIPFEDKKNAIE